MTEKKKAVILITGANGMLANELKVQLQNDYEIKFLSRNPKNENEFRWDSSRNFIDEKAFENVEHIIHLAGASIIEKRWTNQRKKIILNSRVETAKLLLHYVKKQNICLKTYISASAIGYYGSDFSENIFTENASAGNDFLSEVCVKWEATAYNFVEVSDRMVILRFGLIFSPDGGILERMLLPTRLYMNTVLGTGKQIMSWIALEDVVRLIDFCLKKDEVKGIYNAVSPVPISNEKFTHILAEKLGKKIIFPRIPAYFVKMIFGEMSILLLGGSAVSSEKITREGFVFKYPKIEDFFLFLLKNN